jgi:hypothetical protein
MLLTFVRISHFLFHKIPFSGSEIVLCTDGHTHGRLGRFSEALLTVTDRGKEDSE